MANGRSEAAVRHRWGTSTPATGPGYGEAGIHLPGTLAMPRVNTQRLQLLNQRREKDKTLRTYRKVDFIETSLRFSDPSFSGSRTHFWAVWDCTFARKTPAPATRQCQRIATTLGTPVSPPHQDVLPVENQPPPSWQQRALLCNAMTSSS